MRCAVQKNRLTKTVATFVTRKNKDEARLWVTALFLSVLVNGLLLAWLSHGIIQSQILAKELAAKPKPPQEVVKIYPEMVQVEEASAEPNKAEVEATRTSSDQEAAEPPKSRRYIGERNTQATSDTAPTDDEILMPAQKGRELRPNEQFETTESRYQDGKLPELNQSAEPNIAPSMPASDPVFQARPMPTETVQGTVSPDPGEAELKQTAAREALLEGPNPIEMDVPEAEIKENIKPRTETKARNGEPDGLLKEKISDKPKPAAKPTNATDPAFRGNQSKTAIRGNISRSGRSALDVADTPMGRYHAKLSRAIELEFQRNCVRRRDFIVPGYLTTRFFVDAQGRVKTVELIGEIEGGEIQKGFTLNSIRDAAIPPMPPAVKKEMDGDALELIFNFYF